LVIGPAAGYASIVDKGEQLCNAPLVQIFALSCFAGCFIGFGALLSLTISGGIDGAIKGLGPGVQTWLYAALFPVNLLFILLSGSILFTGATFTTPAAWIEGRARLADAISVITVSWVGNIVGGFGFAIFTDACGLNSGGVARLAIKVLKGKTTKGFGVVFLRGIGCNWLVCMAVFLQTLASDLSGKYVGIFFPISTFVACGFEHYPANAYALPLAWLASQKDEFKEDGSAGLADIVARNLIPASLGNLFAGVIIMACGFSYFYGSLRTCPPPAFEAAMAGKMDSAMPEDAVHPRLAAVEEYIAQIQEQQRIATGGFEGPLPAQTASSRTSWVEAISANNTGFARSVSC